MNQNTVRNCDKEQEGKIQCVYQSECWDGVGSEEASQRSDVVGESVSGS